MAERTAVLTVPVDAVRSARDAAALAATLGVTAPVSRASERPAAALADAATASAGSRGAAKAAPRASGGSARQAKVVFVQTPEGLAQRSVQLGANDYDHYEVLSGLEEGEEVALLGVAQAQAKRASDQAQVRQRMSSMPGAVGRSTTTGAGGAGTGGR